jgi:glycosyltransferase involved in cell wall biosynthesis
MKISVALCTYNGEKYISGQIKSILDQTEKVDEIVICDDVSTDNTKDILQSIASENSSIKLFFNEKNLGFVNNFENAIKRCSGDIIFLSDQDDIWKKNKVEKMKNVFRQNYECCYLFSNADAFNENEKLDYTLWDSVNFNSVKQNKFKAGMQKELLIRESFVYGAVLAFRAEFKKYFFPISTKFYHDNWIVLILSFLNKKAGYFIPESLINYRIHASQSIGLPTYKKVLRFFRDINNLRQNHKKVFEKKIRMLSDLKRVLNEKKILTKPNRLFLDEMIYFLEQRNEMYNPSKFKRLKIIRTLYLKGFYKTYSTSNIVALKDVIQKVIL